MRLRKFIAGTVVGILLTVGLHTPTPAQAAPVIRVAQMAQSDCQAYPGTFCIFQFTGFNGRVWRQYPPQITGCRSLVPDDFNDRGTVFWNNTGGSHQMLIWEHANCTGWSYALGSGYLIDFTGTGFDNAASGIQDIQF